MRHAPVRLAQHATRTCQTSSTSGTHLSDLLNMRHAPVGLPQQTTRTCQTSSKSGTHLSNFLTEQGDDVSVEEVLHGVDGRVALELRQHDDGEDDKKDGVRNLEQKRRCKKS